MALIEKLKAIADCFRSSRGTTKQYTLDEMAVMAAEAVGSTPVVEPLTVTANGTYNPPEGVDGYSPVTVNVEGSGGSEWEERFVQAIDGSVVDLKFPQSTTEIAKYKFLETKGLLSVTFSDNIETIGQKSFYACRELTTVTWGENTKYIGEEAFDRCVVLTITDLPNNLIEISYRAFEYCTSITNMTFPESITKIYPAAFLGCSALSSVTFRGKPTLRGTDIFQSCPNLLTINVPWAEGEVSGAPWGATNATINYNYTGG
jgi:hypothetical protein